MIRLVTSLCLFLSLTLGAIFGQGWNNRVDLHQVPVRVSLGWQFKKAEIRKPLTVTVTLKDINGVTVPAVKDERVELKYQNQILGGVIAAGQKSITFQITPKAAAIEKLEATASNLEGNSCFVIGIDPRTQTLTEKVPAPVDATGGIRPPAPAPAPGPPPAPPKNPRVGAPPGVLTTASGPSIGLQVYVSPDPVDFDADSGSWKAGIIVALTGSDGNLANAKDDIQLLLVPASGKVTPPSTTIKKNQPLSDQVTLAWNEAEDNDLQVTSNIAHVTRHIAHDNPQPVALRLEAVPGSVINDGKSPVRILVMLVDARKTPAPAATDTEVDLSSSRGNINPSRVIVAKGQCCAEATLTSAQRGSVTVSAMGPGLPQTEIPAMFLFPVMMVVMGALGGLLGAFVHNPRAAFGAHRWRVLALGLIFGVILSIAALLGVIASLPKLGLPVQISQIPSANELGAFLLGFVGGLYGKKLWLKGDSDEDKQPKAKASQPA